MQAKTEMHGFMQLHIQEVFCQGSPEKIIIKVVQLPWEQCSWCHWYLWLYPIELLLTGKLSH